MPPSQKPDHQRRPTFLRAWRKHVGLTQAKVGEVLDLEQSSIGRMEKGETPYDQDYLEMLADLYGCREWDLLARDPKKDDALAAITAELKNKHPELIPEIVGYIRGEISAAERAKVASKAGTQGKSGRPLTADEQIAVQIALAAEDQKPPSGRKPDAPRPAKPEAGKSRRSRD